MKNVLTIFYILLLALAIYLNIFQLPGFEGQREEIRKYRKMYNR